MNTAVGKITAEDIFDTVSRYLCEHPTRKILWNFLQADGSGISSEDFLRLQSRIKSLSRLPEKRAVAIVVAREIGYGLARLSAAYAQIVGMDVDYNVFYTLKEAEAWLSRQDDGQGQAP